MLVILGATLYMVHNSKKPYTFSVSGPRYDNESIGDVIAIGSVHGDLMAFKNTLYFNGVINRSGYWVAGNRTVVQTGDLIDKGPNDKKILEFVYNIQEEALENGGEWVQLLGNHEYLNLKGHTHYSVDGPGDDIGFGSQEKRKIEMEEGYLGQWLRTLPIVYKWKDVVFVHGGIPNIHIAKLGIDKINQMSYDYFNYTESISDTKTQILDKILWDTSLVKSTTNNCKDFYRILKELKASQMVVGHLLTNKLGFKSGEIGSHCHGKLKMINTGMSSYYEMIRNRYQGLHIYSFNL